MKIMTNVSNENKENFANSLLGYTISFFFFKEKRTINL